MLIFDQLKKNDPQLRLVAVMLTAGLLILLAGLWWVQVVSARTYQNHLETQSYRTIRLPAVRGKILDCTGTNVLAENRPRYNLCLNLDALSQKFEAAFKRVKRQALAEQKQRVAEREKLLGRSLSKVERRQMAITTEELEQLARQTRLQVVAEVVGDVSRRMDEPIALDPAKFERAYATRLAMPYPILTALSATNIARFEENFTNFTMVDLDLQSERDYPLGNTAAHLLGYVKRDDSSAEGEEAFFSYRLPDYSGISGIEGRYNSILRGSAGAESVLVNNLGYRQSENVWTQPEPGHSVVLTVDLDIQRAAEESMLHHQGPNVLGAVVVMDVHSGDVLAMVSSPAINPDYSQNDPVRMRDPRLRPEINRATQENLAPGSIFKTVVAIAALENGLNPKEIYHVQADPEDPAHGAIFVGRSHHHIGDTAPPGDYDFKKAFIHSSNSYFVNYGLRAGVENIMRVGRQFHLGERTGLFPGHETRGNFPTIESIRETGWSEGDTANLCIGQGEIDVTPVQMAVIDAAIANGGTVLWPRLVQRVEPLEAGGGAVTNYPAGLVRDRVTVQPRNLDLLREAMLADVEDKQGTGTAAAVPGMQICGKTGTAQVKDSAGRMLGHNYWFASYAPFENPRYAVVVMVQSTSGGSGGVTCAPIAHDIYEAILKKETAPPARALASRD